MSIPNHPVDMPASRSIAAPDTSPTTSEAFYVSTGGNLAVRIYGSTAAIGSGESVQIQYMDCQGNWIDLIDAVAGNCAIEEGETSVTIASRGFYRAEKSETAASVGVETIENNPS